MAAAETVGVLASADLPGACLLRVRDSRKSWDMVHDTYVFSWILRADAPSSGRYGAREFHTRSGTLIHLHPGEAQRITPKGATSTDAFFLDPAEARRALDPDGYGPEVVVFPSLQTDAPGPRAAFQALFRALASAEATALERQTLFSLALAKVFPSPRSLRREDPPFGLTRWVRVARDLLHDRFAERVTLTDLEAAAGIDRFRLLRAFGARLGMPPHAYLLGLRVAKARRLLQAGLPSAVVAASCGFADQSHLTRMFRRVYGMTPGRFAAATR